MSNAPYYVPRGGLPDRRELTTERAMFTESYAVLPRRTMSDITTSFLPFWAGMRMWVLARPMTGFAETFSQYVVELNPGGGSDRPEIDPAAEAVLFVTTGELDLGLGSEQHSLRAGSYVFLPPGQDWTLHNRSNLTAGFHWIRKRYQSVEGIETPRAFVTHEDDVVATSMPNTDDSWSTKRFVDVIDLSHDMHVNIVSFEPGGSIPFPETHVMEHGLYVLQGKAVYLLNTDWVEVEAGDFMWLRAFCPQACYAGGPEPFRYLLYKDVNRHAPLGGVLG
ncbi:bifunctional allantoicase/(S)-ureidoglycine aminohydrolase [Dermacoccaceae bacterium W4C1]